MPEPAIQLFLTLFPRTGWVVGQGVRIQAQPQDEAGQPVAITGVVITTLRPDGTPLQHSGGSLGSGPLGPYLDLVLDQAGTWRILVECTGPRAASVEKQIVVKGSDVRTPAQPGAVWVTQDRWALLTQQGLPITAERVPGLPELGEPTGEEQIPVVSGDVTKRTSLASLAQIAATAGAAEAGAAAAAASIAATPNATPSTRGLMAPADKAKLDGVAPGATRVTAPEDIGAASAAVMAAALAVLAPLSSPSLTGSPTAPTPPAGNNSTRLATTAFATAAIASAVANLVNMTIPVIKAAANSGAEGVVSLTRADNVDRTHRLRYRGGGPPNLSYLALDTHDDTLNAGVGGYQQAWIAQRGRTYVSGPFAVESRAAATAIVSIPAVVTMVQTLGYAADGDGGGGLYKRVGANPTSHQGKFATADGTYWELVGPNCNIRQFGAIADDLTDIRVALINAVNFTATKGGGTVRIPAGTYRHYGDYIPVRSGVELVGDGRFASIIYNDALVAPGGAAGGGRVFGGADVSNIAFRDFSVVGAWDQDPRDLSALIRIDRASGVELSGMYIAKSRGYGVFLPWGRDVAAFRCHLHQNARDNLAFYNAFPVRAQGNLITCSPEDGIAYHNVSTLPVPTDAIVITDNILIECPPIHGSGRGAIIANNLCIRARAHGLHIQAEETPGTASQVAVVVANNVVLDCYKKPDSAPGGNKQGYLFIGNSARHSAALTPNGPSMPDGSGGIKDRLGTGIGNIYTIGQETTATTPIESVGGFGFVVTNNILMRTRPDVANVSAWTLDPRGLFEARQGASGVDWYDGPSAGLLNVCDGIVLSPGLISARIAGNIVATTSRYSIVFRDEANMAGGVLPMNYDRVLIEGNVLSHFTVAGVGVDNTDTLGHITGLAGTPQNVLVRGNLFDGDPEHKAAGRLANGKWASSATGPIGVDCAGCSGIRVEDNEFLNVYKPVSAPAGAYVRRNKLFCDPVQVGGYHADNVGIGDCPAPGARFEYVVTDFDPASATYKQQTGPAPGSAMTMPTSGKYVAGTFVEAELPVPDSGRILRGWRRLTTGSSHVLGVDWVAVYDTLVSA